MKKIQNITEGIEKLKQGVEGSLEKVRNRLLATQVLLPSLERIIREIEKQQLGTTVAKIALLNKFEKEYQVDLKNKSNQIFYCGAYIDHRQSQKRITKGFFTAVNQRFQQGLQRKDVTLIRKGLQVTAVEGLWEAAEAYIGEQPNMQSHGAMVQALNEQMQKVAGTVCPEDEPDPSIIFKYLSGKESKQTFTERCKRYQKALTFLKGAEQIGFSTITKVSASCIETLEKTSIMRLTDNAGAKRRTIRK